MKKRVRFNPKKFISRVSGLILLVVLAVMSFLSFTGTLTADAFNEAETTVYIVQSGDTLWDIAKGMQQPNEDIREIVFQISMLNNMDTSDIHPGQELLVPAEVAHDL